MPEAWAQVNDMGVGIWGLASWRGATGDRASGAGGATSGTGKGFGPDDHAGCLADTPGAVQTVSRADGSICCNFAADVQHWLLGENMLTVYGYSYSVYLRVVRLVLAEKRLHADMVEVDPFCELPAGYLELHPFGRVPVLNHNGFGVYETVAITRFLDEGFAGPSLQPTDARARARLTQAIAVTDAYAYWPLVRHVYVKAVFRPAEGSVGSPEELEFGLAGAPRGSCSAGDCGRRWRGVRRCAGGRCARDFGRSAPCADGRRLRTSARGGCDAGALSGAVALVGANRRAAKLGCDRSGAARRRAFKLRLSQRRTTSAAASRAATTQILRIGDDRLVARAKAGKAT